MFQLHGATETAKSYPFHFWETEAQGGRRLAFVKSLQGVMYHCFVIYMRFIGQYSNTMKGAWHHPTLQMKKLRLRQIK